MLSLLRVQSPQQFLILITFLVVNLPLSAFLDFLVNLHGIGNLINEDKKRVIVESFLRPWQARTNTGFP